MLRFLAVPAVGLGGWIVGADTTGLPTWAQALIVLAAFVGVMAKAIVPGWLYTDSVKKVETLEAENKRLVQLLLDNQPKAISAMEASSRVVEDAMAEIRILRKAG